MTYGVGLDMATKRTGTFIYYDQPLPNGGLNGKGNVIKADGWVLMGIAVKTWVLGLDPAPAWVAIEDTYLNENARKQAINPQTRKLLDRLAGFVIASLYEANPQFTIYVGTAAQINAACGLSPFLGHDARKKDLKAFAEMLGFVLPQDAADALATAHWGAAQARKDSWLALGSIQNG